MYSFHVMIHPRSAEVAPGGTLTLAARSVPILQVPQEALATGFSQSFEETAIELAQLPRMFIEPDGSFVWVSADPAQAWQVDGQLFDRHDRLLYLDVKGTCPEAAFNQLLTVCDWPHAPVMFQLVREAVFIDEATFRELAAVSALAAHTA